MFLMENKREKYLLIIMKYTNFIYSCVVINHLLCVWQLEVFTQIFSGKSFEKDKN